MSENSADEVSGKDLAEKLQTPSPVDESESLPEIEHVDEPTGPNLTLESEGPGLGGFYIVTFSGVCLTLLCVYFLLQVMITEKLDSLVEDRPSKGILSQVVKIEPYHEDLLASNGRLYKAITDLSVVQGEILEKLNAPSTDSGLGKKIKRLESQFVLLSGSLAKHREGASGQFNEISENFQDIKQILKDLDIPKKSESSAHAEPKLKGEERVYRYKYGNSNKGG